MSHDAIPRKATRMTKQRAAIVQVMQASPGFASATQIYDRLRAEGSTIGLATVYRTLGTLAAEGVLDALQRPGGTETLYRACGETGHHHHLTCRYCGQTVEVTVPEIEAFARDVAHRHGFEAVEHTVEITGTCRDCLPQR
ncbi:MAG: transcriptional repressor [Bifidobacteriaceae bacterium]|jgi:Fur family ferric uptake transcriptional regulator|nr:transcriptional repressor [Bifidobacteriaceae bacterium]